MVSAKSSETPLSASTTRKCANRVAAGNPRISVRNAADRCWSRHETMVWFSCTLTSLIVPSALDCERSGSGTTHLGPGARAHMPHSARLSAGWWLLRAGAVGDRAASAPSLPCSRGPAPASAPARAGAPSPAPTPVPFGYVPLFPFGNLAAVQAWQVSYASGGRQPWHLNVDQTALAFTQGYLGFRQINKVAAHRISVGDARVTVGSPWRTAR